MLNFPIFDFLFFLHRVISVQNPNSYLTKFDEEYFPLKTCIVTNMRDIGKKQPLCAKTELGRGKCIPAALD